MLVACATDASGTTYTDINKTVFAEASYVVTYKSNGDGTCTVTASSDEAVALRLQAFDYFYHSANKIKCIIVPEGTEVIGIDSLLVTYHTVDAD